MSAALVLLAAGRGTRFGGSKQTTPVGPAGEWLLDYALYDARRAGFSRAVLVVRPGSEPVFETLASRVPSDFALTAVPQLTGLVDATRELAARDVPWGTAHAVLAARRAVGSSSFAVINADDFYGADAYRLAVAEGASVAGLGTLVAMRLGDTLSPHGPVTRAICQLEGGHLVGLRETPGIERRGPAVTSGTGALLDDDAVVSMNFWVLPHEAFGHLERLFRDFQLRPDAQSREFLLPAAISTFIGEGILRVRSVTAPGPWYGLTHAADLPFVRAGLARLTERGIYPSPLWN